MVEKMLDVESQKQNVCQNHQTPEKDVFPPHAIRLITT